MGSARKFEILWESRSTSWAKDLGILFTRVPEVPIAARPFRYLKKNKTFKPFAGVVLSILLHATAFVLITQLDFSQGYQPSRVVEASDTGPIYLDLEALKTLHILRSLPTIKPAGAGGRAGSGEKPVRVILQAATIEHPKFTMVINPMKADNNHQSITQKLSPPDLKIQVDQKVPDIVLPEEAAPARPQVDMSLHQPMAPTKAQNRPGEAAPSIVANAPELSFKINPTVQQPRMPVSFLGSNSALHANDSNGLSSAQNHATDAAPAVASNGPELSLDLNPNVQGPRMPGTYFASSSLQTPHANSGAGRSGSADSNTSGDSNGGVVVVSVDPGTFSKLASLAQGNRYAAIAIAPSKQGLGSPGGSPNGTASGGSGGPGRGGDSSSGVGPGHSGGGGGGAEGQLRATMSAVGGSGGPGGVDSNKLLGRVLPSTIIPIISPTKIRRAPLVVSTGPVGGGGLEVYGALTCGRVYTIFLPMPGKNWVLEYCAHQASEAKTGQSGTGTVQVESILAPPTADQQFDFRRLAIPEKDADKLIVLKGMIDKDGSITDVHVFQGVQPEMDAQAAIAFSNWKFRPATRANLPISVDVLVGIPAHLPERPNQTPSGPQGN